MKRAAKIVVFILLCLLVLLGLLVLFPFLKEGFSRSELPFLFAGAGGFAALALFWVWLARPAWGWVISGCLLLAAPALSYLAIGGDMVWQQAKAGRLAAAAKIENFTETPLTWPGFAGPVGIRIAFDLRHPEGAAGSIYAPELRMGPAVAVPPERFFATYTSGGGYFKDTYLDQSMGPLALLKTPLYQKLTEPRFANRRPEAGGSTSLVYDFYPGILETVESQAHFCLAHAAPGLPRCAAGQAPESGCVKNQRPAQLLYYLGDDLSAHWGIAAPSDAVADLSQLLTTVLRRHSALQRRPEAWQAMQERLEPASLTAAGYALCAPGPESHSGWRVCYCREE